MLIERITMQGNDTEVMRELAPEYTLRATPAYPDERDYPLAESLGNGNSHVASAPNSDEV